MTNYVVGFLFSSSMGQVVLVEKQRPEWQAGKLNGVGGKIEDGESDYEAMAREFREETGKDVSTWTRFCILKGDWGILSCFYAVAEDYNTVKTVTDKEIVLWDVDYVMDHNRSETTPNWFIRLLSMGEEIDTSRPEIIPNVRWLIQMARSFSMGEGVKEFIVDEVCA